MPDQVNTKISNDIVAEFELTLSIKDYTNT